MLTLTDDILWDSFRQGNKDALASLFDRHYASLHRYARKFRADTELVNDLIQDLFIEIWHQRSPKPVLSIQGYLIQSLRYKLIRQVRQTNTPETLSEAEAPFVISPEDFLIVQEGDKQQHQELTAALATLSPRQREVIYLRFYLNLPYREICMVLTMDHQVARNHLHAGLKRMRALLQSESRSQWLDSLTG